MLDVFGSSLRVLMVAEMQILAAVIFKKLGWRVVMLAEICRLSGGLHFPSVGSCQGLIKASL